MLRPNLIAPHEIRGVATELRANEVGAAVRETASKLSAAKPAPAGDFNWRAPAGNSHGANGGRMRHLFDALFPKGQRLARSQRDLSDTKDELQSLSDEHQTTLEELRSANEELHSVNEELQSSNEELETSKEELQSLNEELHTVNKIGRASCRERV